MSRSKLFISSIYLPISLLTFLIISFPNLSFSQENLLTKKIIYRVEILKPKIQSTRLKDSIIYDFHIDKRFWWESIDLAFDDIKKGKLHFSTLKGDTINYNRVIKRLKQDYFSYYKDSLSDLSINNLFENEIRAIKFMEEWYYNQDNLLIDKKVLAFNPIIKRDSIIIIDIGNKDTELGIEEGFSYELGWIFPKTSNSIIDTLCLASNIEFTIPIYNNKPYHWWNSHLEPEYSFPYFNKFLNFAEQGKIDVYPQPNSSSKLNKLEIKKKKEYEMMIRLVIEDNLGNLIEKDSIVKGEYNPDYITWLRFGEEWYFDKNTKGFAKTVNYISPMVEILGLDKSFRGLMPIYYIRRK